MRLLSKFSVGGRRGLWVGLLILLGVAVAGYFSTQRGLGRIDGPVFVFDAVVGLLAAAWCCLPSPHAGRITRAVATVGSRFC